MGVINRCRSISSEYLWLWFQALDLQDIYDGSNVPQINNKDIEPLSFPVCGELEQREIVRVLSITISNADRTISDINAQIQRGQALRQAILKKAFAGQLAPQDPSEEPASVLLYRIRTERMQARGLESPRKIGRRQRASATA